MKEFAENKTSWHSSRDYGKTFDPQRCLKSLQRTEKIWLSTWHDLT